MWIVSIDDLNTIFVDNEGGGVCINLLPVNDQVCDYFHENVRSKDMIASL